MLENLLIHSKADRDAFCQFLSQVRRAYYAGNMGTDLLNAAGDDAERLGFSGNDEAWSYLLRKRMKAAEDEQQIRLL